ncbi:hypothetical protein R5W60_04590 [Brucella pseudintermedia]|uniref:hypothetical protein n=1 Tax=Brucella pseudintermedia TaxID=370111 RepID=UPI002F61213F|nr:hypothetical protein R5W60_04590 [Brucella pseudintermedia]
MAFLAPIGAAIGSAVSSVTSTIGTAATILGGGLSAAGTIASANAQANAAEFEAKQAEQRAAEERAASVQEAQLKRKEGQLMQSRLQAAAAASGAGAGTDAPTVAMLGESIAGQSRLNQLMETYGGESRARGYEDQAASRRASARSARLGGLIGAGTSILGGISRYKGIA